MGNSCKRPTLRRMINNQWLVCLPRSFISKMLEMWSLRAGRWSQFCAVVEILPSLKWESLSGECINLTFRHVDHSWSLSLHTSPSPLPRLKELTIFDVEANVSSKSQAWSMLSKKSKSGNLWQAISSNLSSFLWSLSTSNVKILSWRMDWLLGIDNR